MRILRGGKTAKQINKNAPRRKARGEVLFLYEYLFLDDGFVRFMRDGENVSLWNEKSFDAISRDFAFKRRKRRKRREKTASRRFEIRFFSRPYPRELAVEIFARISAKKRDLVRMKKSFREGNGLRSYHFDIDACLVTRYRGGGVIFRMRDIEAALAAQKKRLAVFVGRKIFIGEDGSVVFQSALEQQPRAERKTSVLFEFIRRRFYSPAFGNARQKRGKDVRGKPAYVRVIYAGNILFRTLLLSGRCPSQPYSFDVTLSGISKC